MTEPIIPPYVRDSRHSCPEWMRPSIKLAHLCGGDDKSHKGGAKCGGSPLLPLASLPSSLVSRPASCPADPKPAAQLMPAFPKPTRTEKPRHGLTRKKPLSPKGTKGKTVKVKCMKRRGSIVHDLDRLFRRIQKLDWADGKEYVRCYTCGAWIPVSAIEVGHYHSRRYMAIRWDERNVRPQCHKCNQDMEGASGAERARIIYNFYTERLKAELGAEFAELEAHKRDKFLTVEMEELAAVMKARLKGMEGKE